MTSRNIPATSWHHPVNLTFMALGALIFVYALIMTVSDERGRTLCQSVGHTHYAAGSFAPFPNTFTCYTPVRYSITTTEVSPYED